MIHGLSFQLLVNGNKLNSVNDSSNKSLAHQESMYELGNVIPHIIWTIALSKDKTTPFMFTKVDLKDGLQRTKAATSSLRETSHQFFETGLHSFALSENFQLASQNSSNIHRLIKDSWMRRNGESEAYGSAAQNSSSLSCGFMSGPRTYKTNSVPLLTNRNSNYIGSGTQRNPTALARPGTHCGHRNTPRRQRLNLVRQPPCRRLDVQIQEKHIT
jgi:hypothetical protein